MGVEPERVIIWDTLEITVGRLDTQDIIVPDPEVSRRHAVLQRRGTEFLVEDLGTPLRTFVNGEPIKSQPLSPGDIVTIGLLELELRQTEETLRPSNSVTFASHLKGLGLPDDGDAGGRTMLGVAMELPLVPEQEAAPAPPVARVVTADGSLEEASQVGIAAPGDDEFDLAGSPPVRDLDSLLNDSGTGLDPVGLGGAHSTSPTRPHIASVDGPDGGEALGSVVLRLEIEGPPAAVEALADALCGKRIEVAPLVLHVRPAAR